MENSRYNPKFRRRKKHQGSTWTPENQPALKPDGAWCRWCKTRHGYMTMGINYEKRTRKETIAITQGAESIKRTYWVILWSCKKTGYVIEEMELHGKDRKDVGVSNPNEAGSD